MQPAPTPSWLPSVACRSRRRASASTRSPSGTTGRVGGHRGPFAHGDENRSMDHVAKAGSEVVFSTAELSPSLTAIPPWWSPTAGHSELRDRSGRTLSGQVYRFGWSTSPSRSRWTRDYPGRRSSLFADRLTVIASTARRGRASPVSEVRSHLLGRADLGEVAQRVPERCAQDEPRLSLQLGIYTIWIR